MSLLKYKTLAAVVETGSLTRAASELGCTQSAVSHSIDSLEKELGFALLLIFSSPFGKALKEAGFAVVFSPTGIVFAQMIVNLPFAIRMMRTAFGGINPRVEFVAQTLGAMPWDVFRTIIVPMCRNQIISTFVLTWARGMGEFGATLMLVGVTRMKTETLPGSIYLSISTGNTETAMATAMIMLLVSALTLVVPLR